MDFSLTEEQKFWQDNSKEFAQKHLRPLSEKFDNGLIAYREVAMLANKYGLRHWWIPKQYGGIGISDKLTSCVIAEEISWACLGLMEAVAGPSLAGHFLLNLGNEEQKVEYLSKMADSNGVYTAAFAVTEENAGSDIKNILTIAQPTNGGYLISGEKKYITNGDIADVIILAANLLLDGKKIFKFFIIDRAKNTDFQTTRIQTAGLRGAHVAALHFENFFIPESALLGFGAGNPNESDLLAFLQIMETARVAVGAASLGIARAAWEYTTEYTKNRILFGSPLISNQAIKFSLIDAKVKIDAARLLVWQAAWLVDNGSSLTNAEGNLAKLFAANTAYEVVTTCAEYLGARAFSVGHPMEKWLRDVRACLFWEGTPNILKMSSARILW